MPDELAELIDSAVYKEIAAEAFYIAGQKEAADPVAKVLLGELAAEEAKHAEWLKQLKDRVVAIEDWHPAESHDLAISEYLTGGESLGSASLQEILLFAIKREQHAMEFYSRLEASLTDPTARDLCAKLAQSERGHKQKLEILYDDMLAAAGN